MSESTTDSAPCIALSSLSEKPSKMDVGPKAINGTWKDGCDGNIWAGQGYAQSNSGKDYDENDEYDGNEINDDKTWQVLFQVAQAHLELEF